MSTTPDLSEILLLSHTYGKNPLWIIGGGGNISLKQGNRMWIKASGMTLEEIQRDGFVEMNLEALQAMVRRQYPEDSAARENLAKEMLLSCRLPGEDQKRPSVETGMHAVIPHRIVFHTHPTLINGLTCSRDGKAWAEKLFGDTILWVPVVNPGIVLSRYLLDHFKNYHRAIFLQNHGLVVYGKTPEEIESFHRTIEGRLLDALPKNLRSLYEEWKQEQPLAAIQPGDTEKVVTAFYAAEKGVPQTEAPIVFRDTSPFFKPYFTSIEAFSSIDGPFTPDHVVYAGHALLWVDQMNRLQEALRTYRIKQGGQMPGVIAVKDVGIFFVGQNEKKARIIYLLARDMVRISLLAKAFGGVQFMPEEQTEFIRHWEVEQFRKKVT